ncbi:MAG: PAS domain S-box-containing protein [Desulforhopalus sp.]|jgi:PAS domain S-box-containing protein
MPKKSDETYFFKCFSAIFVTTLFLVTILLVIHLINEKKHRRIQLASEAVGYLEAEQRRVNDVLDSITSDLLTLAKSSDAAETIESGSPPNNLLENLLIFSRNKRVYDQIRYLDKTGQEIVRINYNNGKPAVVPIENLQNKAGRYYFKDVIKLGMGEIFISPFDLNIEHGKIEEPIKPMIRFGTPIFDNQGNKKGILLLNYLGAELISAFERKDSKYYEYLFVLNNNGYWLRGQNSDQEWGFMYEDKQEATFANIFPAAWKQIQNAEFGQFDFNGGLITFTTVYPLQEAAIFSSMTDIVIPSGNRRGLLEEKQYFWKIVHHVPTETFRSIYKSHTINLLWLFATLSCVVAVISWIFATLMTKKRLNIIALMESEERFKALHNASMGGISIHDKGIILECNQGLVDITGYSRFELIGMNGLLLIAEKSKNDVMDKILSGYDKPYEAIGLRKSGEEYPVRLEARNIPYKNKTVRTVEFRDITEKKLAEEESTMLEVQLQQAQKMEAIGTLAGGIAHDFNNILSAIYGYTQLAQMHIGNPEQQKESLDGVTQAANRARNLVKHILTFSRKGKQEKFQLSISSLAKEVVAMLRQTVPSTIDISHEISSSGTILADPSQIHQVLMNLCTNAYHSMRKEGGTLRIRVIDKELEKAKILCGTTVPPGKYTMICVSDSGAGMDDKTMKKIFEPFFTTKIVGEGTGLGLAVVHGIVADHQGYILVDSKRGVGTTFRVYLPVSDGKDVKAITKSVPHCGLQGSERILFVDDENAIQKIFGKVFRKYGYQATIFGDPEEALAHFKVASDQFDLLITDMTMPKMTGIELINKVLEIKPDLPVILCTGYSDLINAEAAHKQGIINFVEKPFTMSHLLNISRRAMRSLKQ